MRDPIIITGIPRSGTSMIAGIINICGAFMGNTNKMMENQELKDRLLIPFMRSIGAEETGQINHPDLSSLQIPVGFRKNVLDIYKAQGWAEEQPLAIKSNLVALTWPIWQYAFPNAKFIIVRRRTGDIVNSCIKTGYMNKHDTKEGWVEMCRSYQNRFSQMIEEGMNCKVIWPHRMVFGDYSQIWDMLEWLGLEWNTEILNWVDPKFIKIRKTK